MWEPVRQDGKLKLKSNAIPTIFGDKVLQLPSIKRRGTYFHTINQQNNLSED